MKSIKNEARLLNEKSKLVSIPFVGHKFGVLLDLAHDFLSYNEEILQKVTSKNICSSNYESSLLKYNLIELVSSTLNCLPGSRNVVDELLATASVIFCTLSSSGVSALKQTR